MWNEKPVVTIYSILLYGKYFLSYCKISSVFSDFRQICQKRHLFRDYSKSICRRAKWSIWLQSAFHSANFEYNIIKIREKKFPTFYNIGRFQPPWIKGSRRRKRKKNLSVIFDPKHTPIQLCSLKFKFFDKTGHPSGCLYDRGIFNIQFCAVG